MKRQGLHALLAVFLASGATVALAQAPHPDRLAARQVPASLASSRLAAPITAQNARAILDRSLAGAKGAGRVIIRLSADSAAIAFAKGADSAQAKRNARAQQDAFLASVRRIDPDARVIAQVQSVLNAVFVDVKALLFTNGDRTGNHGGATQATEALLFLAP
ncbi:MAG: hypothetical protein IT493_09300 [Gammaproteobacteria bacterium]|nr:hypothetical protein [Gammaproteobacteria bacterium]